jgi:hypothetical protein
MSYSKNTNTKELPTTEVNVKPFRYVESASARLKEKQRTNQPLNSRRSHDMPAPSGNGLQGDDEVGWLRDDE